VAPGRGEAMADKLASGVRTGGTGDILGRRGGCPAARGVDN
jgi:hypothetical protein